MPHSRKINLEQVRASLDKAGTALSEFLFQGPISAFVGTTGIGTSFEDIPLVEDLGSGTC
jgi:hypothetical protein